MKLLPALALCSALLSCREGDCPPARTISEALDQSCGTSMNGPTGPAPPPRPGTITTVAGTGDPAFTPDGQLAVETALYNPMDLTVSADGTPYIIDWNNHLIRAINAQGKMVTVAGIPGELGDVDSTPDSMPSQMPEPALQHRLNHPTNLIFDETGRMFMAAWHNSAIKRVDFDSMIIRTVCGTGRRTFGGDNGPALTAHLDLPVGIAFSPSGDLYISDQANQRIRKVDRRDQITTVVGNPDRDGAGNFVGGYGGDGGPASEAKIDMPVGQAAMPAGRIAFDNGGNLYIADTGNHRIRKVDTRGIITTVAGNGVKGAEGEGVPATMAQLNSPRDVEIGPDGTLYIADTYNNCVRAVGSDGNIRTVAGQCGVPRPEDAPTGDGGEPTRAWLNRPFGIETDTHGNLWIADTFNNRIRLVCNPQGGGPRCTAM